MPDKTAIVLHHSLTADSGTVSWGAIRRYHVETNGWREIGYHYGIELVGGKYEILVGRMEEETAAAAPGANEDGIHICVVGNFDDAPPPAEQLAVAVKLAASIALRHNIPVDRIFGHCDFNPHKSCPGRKFNLPLVHALVADRLRSIG